MQRIKNIQAINLDRVQIRHPTLDLSDVMSSYVTVRHNGIGHLVVSTPTPRAKRLGMTTAQFSIGGHPARIVESVDSNDYGASVIRYEGTVETRDGCLWVQSYDSATHTTDLLSALEPAVNSLGVGIGRNHRVEFASPPEVLLDVADLGLLRIVPLTAEVLQTMPDWKGTSVSGGELFAGHVSRSQAMLTLITDSAQVDVLPALGADMDALTDFAAELHVSWTP